MKLSVNLFCIVLLSTLLLTGCDSEEGLSPYEMESWVELEGDLTRSKIKRIMRSGDPIADRCDQVHSEINKFMDTVDKHLNVLTGPRPYEPDINAEQVARRRAINIYNEYLATFRRTLEICRAEESGSDLYYDTDYGVVYF